MKADLLRARKHTDDMDPSSALPQFDECCQHRSRADQIITRPGINTLSSHRKVFQLPHREPGRNGGTPVRLDLKETFPAVHPAAQLCRHCSRHESHRYSGTKVRI